ncbi:hypothetical protein [Streptomyces alboflavus]|uniref:hypothetical protein n=1 Tax=Streptomyces alboflavus TaxID=67267 RepID=UPI0036CD118F
MPLPRHVQERRSHLIGEEVALVRPYLLAHEHRLNREHAQRERHLQRERRTAAALASMGIDYDIAIAI